MRIIISIILTISSISVFSQNMSPYILIEFENLHILTDNHRSLYFKIDNIVIKPDNKKHQIIIKKNSLDTISISSDSSFNSNSFSLAKFKNGESYIIRINHCSEYELLPLKNAKTGKYRFKTIKCSDTLVAFSGNDTEPLLIFPHSTSHYELNHPSGMCYFSKTSFSYAKKNYSDETTWEEKKELILSEVNFHFLHGEIVTIEYDGATKRININVNSYLK